MVKELYPKLQKCLAIPKGWENAAFSDIPFIHVYTDYRIDGTRQTIEERYTNREWNFYITIPPILYGKVTVEKLDDGVRIVSNTDQKILFEVKRISKDLFVDSKIKLKERSDTVFYTDIKEKTSIPVENFNLLEDEF